jgi:hypothetical protein
MRAKFTIFYCVMGNEPRSIDIKSYFKLFEPDAQTLTDALLQIAQISDVITVLKADANGYSVVYVVPGKIEGVQCKEAYEFLVQKEKGLSKVAEEIAGKNSRKSILIGALVLAGIPLLFYIGYHYHALLEINNLLLLIGIFFGVFGGIIKGYQKKRVRASAPHHGSE